MATLTISGLKKLKTHSIEIKSPDDIWGLNDQLAELTDEPNTVIPKPKHTAYKTDSHHSMH